MFRLRFWAREGDWHRRGVRLNILGWFLLMEFELDGLKLRMGGAVGLAWF